MVDRLTPERRSKLMSRVGSKNTGPELTVRRALHSLGCRYGLHAKDLPGKPDIVMRSRRAVVFVHGCFWHRHPKCRKSSNPSTRVDFWTEKFRRNVDRDRANRAALRREHWRVLVVWECETRNSERLKEKLSCFVTG
jgi:DNA mismatch endonuclease (patch repair protein)